MDRLLVHFCALLVATGVAAGYAGAGCNLSDPVRERGLGRDVEAPEAGAADARATDGTDSSENTTSSDGSAVDTVGDASDASAGEDGGAPDGDASTEVSDDAGGGGTCDDGRKNGGETDIDCGGGCGPCGLGEGCADAEDCASEHCGEDGTCVATCDDEIANGDETGVDCGGSTCDGCTAGSPCERSGDCDSGWCKEGVCTVRIEGSLTANDAGGWSDGSVASDCDAYRRPDENHHVYTSASGTPGDGIYEIEPAGASGPFTVYCEMDRADGGWTLVVVSADDGKTTWNWNNRKYFSTDTSTFGSPAKRREDFKSRAYHALEIEDLLFVHQPSGLWLSYEGVGSGSRSIAALVDDQGETCYADATRPDNVRSGYEKTAGSVSATADLCSTDLYLNPKDQDGGGKCTDDDHAFGPAWSINSDGAGCPFDDPGEGSSLGPNYEKKSKEHDCRGFAAPLGETSSGDALLMFVR